MLNFIMKKLGILNLRKEIEELKKENKFLKQNIDNHRKYVNEKVQELKEYTRVDADVGFRGNNTIILTGIYRNKAYVRFWDVGDGEFVKLVDHLRYLKEHSVIRNVDSLPNFRGTFDI